MKLWNTFLTDSMECGQTTQPYRWFAWRPVKCTDGVVRWLETLWRVDTLACYGGGEVAWVLDRVWPI